MNYYLADKGQTVGPFPGEQLREFYQQGKLDGTTPCCGEGQASWQTVAALFGGANSPPSSVPVLPPVFQHEKYLLRRKVFSFPSATFHLFAADGSLVFFSKKKAFKLREDIRIYTDETMTREVLSIKARQVIDFSAAYDVVDTETQAKLGAFRRKGFSSLIRDAWLVMDVHDREIGQILEDNMALALIRRLVLALIPQKFHLSLGGKTAVHFKQQFNPFIYKLEIGFEPNCALDKRMGLAAAVLLAAIEGRQE